MPRFIFFSTHNRRVIQWYAQFQGYHRQLFRQLNRCGTKKERKFNRRPTL
ncbi:hypothetical protein DESC_260039 [Desulfosarcina cetonica]|nr:hypothetical protein DESC_260039 [Desulfosarcina cetonica]